ncbi:MAG: hypothetical protein M1821_002415 [Bathelium mastoideum]|nr:MAG: hypothetical protein M1821_002415 [Bathelium mastoideum]
MDPLSALSVAASSIQIIDFGSRLLKKIFELYRSETGNSKVLNDLKDDCKLMRTGSGHILDLLKADKIHREPTIVELDILSISRECDRIAKHVLETINELTVKDKANKIKLFCQAVKILWKKENIEFLHQRLENVRQSLMMLILINLQSEFHAVRKSQQNLETSWSTGRDLGAWLSRQEDEMKKWRDNLSIVVGRSSGLLKTDLNANKSLAYIEQSYANLKQPYASRNLDGQVTRDFASLHLNNEKQRPPLLKSDQSGVQFPHWLETPLQWDLLDNLLRHLYFKELPRREDRIPMAFEKTFEWIFAEREAGSADQVPWSRFSDWLRGDSSLYWLTGKAGSGKSTLMKFIFLDQRTERLLLEWSGDQPLVIAAFFFWNSGTNMQMSKEGLLRSLLYQALSARRKHLHQSSAVRWDLLGLSKNTDEAWSWAELEQAFFFLLDDSTELLVHYAFFIDGLDEFEGSKASLITFVERLTSYSNVKVCVASRPWAVFEDAFGRQPSVMLQHHTSRDIRSYAEKKFEMLPAFSELKQGDPVYAAKIMQNITSKASGVFLWVVLVVRSLSEGLTEGDRFSDLQRRLDDLPEELEELFQKIMGSLKPAHMQHASHLFQIVRAAIAPPTLLTMFFADEDDLPLNGDMQPLTEGEIESRVRRMKRRLDSRCKGLLEANTIIVQPRPLEFQSQRKRLADAEVEFLHRTVKDFVQRQDIWNSMTSADNSNFNANVSLCRSHTLQLRAIASDESDLRFDHHFWDNVSASLEYVVRMIPQDVEAYFSSLNALDQAATAYSRRHVRNGQHWANVVSDCSGEEDFLNFAVRCNLLKYLEIRFAEERPSQERRDLLLHTATVHYNSHFSRTDRSVITNHKPLPHIIEFLINQGSDRNYRLHESAPSKSVKTLIRQHPGLGNIHMSDVGSDTASTSSDGDGQLSDDSTVAGVKTRRSTTRIVGRLGSKDNSSS